MSSPAPAAAPTGDPEATAPAGPRFWLETFGCQMNVLDSELVGGRLARLGYRRAASAAEADLVLLNTCSVRELAEQKVWSRLGRLGRMAPRPQVAVLGCMAERQAAALKARMPHVDVVCGPSHLHRLPELLAAAAGGVAVAGRRSGRAHNDAGCLHGGVTQLDRERPPPVDASRRAFVRITRGCNKFCSFCVVPHTRGAEVHRDPDELVEEVRRLVDHGVAEVTLLGQTINHYLFRGGGRTTSFADLLFRLHEAAPRLPRLRFLTSYPRDFGDDALDAMAACPRICRYLHLPAQSGSDRVLARMNRGYGALAYLDLLARARARMPDIRISGDMIAGFPGETPEDQEASLSLLDRASYKSCFIFKYSPRAGTVAHRRLPDDVPEPEKAARLQALLARQAEISGRHHRRLVGRRVRVLVDSVARVAAPRGDGELVALGRPGAPTEPWVRLLSRTEGDEIVAFDGPPRAVGHLLEVDITSATHLSAAGRLATGSVVGPHAAGLGAAGGGFEAPTRASGAAAVARRAPAGAKAPPT